MGQRFKASSVENNSPRESFVAGWDTRDATSRRYEKYANAENAIGGRALFYALAITAILTLGMFLGVVWYKLRPQAVTIEEPRRAVSVPVKSQPLAPSTLGIVPPVVSPQTVSQAPLPLVRPTEPRLESSHSPQRVVNGWPVRDVLQTPEAAGNVQ